MRGTINGSLSAAYKHFLRGCITEFHHWQAAIVREYAKPGQFITHNFDFSWTGHSFGIHPEVDQFASAKCMDIAGVDIYHPSQEHLTGAEIAFGGSVARALKKDNYLVLETQSQGLLPWLPYPGQLRLQAYSHLASCANSIMYWNWHSIHNSFESYWKGILSHNLEPGAAYEELKEFGAEVHSIEKHLINLQKKCSAAIVIDNASLTGFEEFPVNTAAPDEADYNHILRRFFDACYELNIECDMVSVEDDFSKYPFLIVPALYSASEDTLHKIDSYVQNGGHLLLSFRSGFSDEELKIYHDGQPHLLTECIGATYDQFTRPENVSIRFHEKDGFQPVPETYPVSSWIELVHTTTAETWASYEHPFWGKYAAVTHHNYGSGSATYLACFAAMPAIKEIIKRVCHLADIHIPAYSFPLIHKCGYNDYGRLVHYYFNYSSSPTAFVYDGKAGLELIENCPVNAGEKLEIKPWDLKIVEETPKTSR